MTPEEKLDRLETLILGALLPGTTFASTEEALQAILALQEELLLTRETQRHEIQKLKEDQERLIQALKAASQESFHRVQRKAEARIIELEAKEKVLLRALDDAHDWMNGYLGYLDVTGREIPAGLESLFDKLTTLIDAYHG